MGNDFIPALPLSKWEIHEGAINKVVDAWRKSTISQKGYIVKNGNINPDRLENLFKILSGEEDFPPEPAGEFFSSSPTNKLSTAVEPEPSSHFENDIDEAARYPSLAPKKDSATPGIRDASILSTSVREPNSILWARHRPTEDRSRYREDENLDLPEGFPALAPTSKAKSGSPGPAGLFEEYVPAQDVGTEYVSPLT